MCLIPDPADIRGEEPPASVRLSPIPAVAGMHPAHGDRQEGCGWGPVVEAGAAEDEEVPAVVTAVEGPFSVSPAAPPCRFRRSAPAGGSLLRRLVPVPQVTSGSECQVTLGVGWQLLGFSGMAKCSILATKGIFLLLDRICFLTASMLNVAPTQAEAGHGRYWGHRPHRLLLCCSPGGLEQIKHWGRPLQGHHFSERL